MTARLEMQARALHGEQHQSMLQVLRSVHAEHGLQGLFQGLLPRMGTNVWLTLFMLSGANIIMKQTPGEGTDQRAKAVERTMTGRTIVVGNHVQ